MTSTLVFDKLVVHVPQTFSLVSQLDREVEEEQEWLPLGTIFITKVVPKEVPPKTPAPASIENTIRELSRRRMRVITPAIPVSREQDWLPFPEFRRLSNRKIKDYLAQRPKSNRRIFDLRGFSQNDAVNWLKANTSSGYFHVSVRYVTLLDMQDDDAQMAILALS